MQFPSAVKMEFTKIINANKRMHTILTELTKNINHPYDLYNNELTAIEEELQVAEAHLGLLDVAAISNNAIRTAKSKSYKGGGRRRTRRLRPRL